MANYKFLLHDPETKPPFQELDWIPTITPDDIAKIADSLVTTTSAKIGTSIPTPLARLFTFQTAFSIVTRQIQSGEDIDVIRESVYGGIVSDCLDFLEWIFVHGIEGFEQITINLTDENDFGQGKNLAALSKAFNSTIRSYFNDNLTITLFRHRASGKIVGGTSPYSLVYTSPNWRREKTEDLRLLRGLTSDNLFDDEFCLLNDRDIRFVSYLHNIVSPILDAGNNTHPLKQFAEYIQATIVRFELQTVSYKSNEVGTFNVMDGVDFGFRKIDIRDDEHIDSDFYLLRNLRHISGGKKPLVLSSTMTLPGQYVKGTAWNRDNIVDFNAPYHPDLNARRLPRTRFDFNYPFIIDSDLFQSKLIDVSYNVNSDFFHTIVSSKYGTRFLLPVKPLFFEIVGLDNLKLDEHLRVTESGNILTLQLFIPVVGSSPPYQERRIVTFEKQYKIDSNLAVNDILQCPFELAFFPFFRRLDENGKNNHKKLVLWLERSNAEKLSSNILFYDNSFEVIGNDRTYNPYTQLSNDEARAAMPSAFPLKPHHRMSYDDSKYNTKYFALNSDYRIVEIKVEGVGGLLVPKFIEKRGPFNRKYKYAVDFGTTNTHIEYAQVDHLEIIENTKSPFKVEVSDNVPRVNEKPLVVLMHRYSDNLGDLDKVYPILMREFMPPSMGNGGNNYNISFPTRSVVLDFNDPTSIDDAAFLHSNIAFKIGEKDDFHPQAIYTPDLKWLLEKSNIVNKDAYKNRIRMFFEQLFYMIKYKAVMDDCDEANLTICFTRPMSMKGTPLNDTIQDQIKRAIRKVFSNANPDDANRFIFELDESIAPFENNKYDFTTRHFANIDIGGGTTDMLIGYKINNVDYRFYLSSARFAGNQIWGNEVNPKKHNGIVQYFMDVANKKSEAMREDHPYKIAFQQFMQYYNKGLTDSELVSVLFKNNKILDFTESVFGGCVDFKMLLFIHYSAILYFINFIISKYKDKGLGYPLTVSLSGNGSLYLKLLFAEDLTDMLLRKFSKSSTDVIEKFIETNNPKEITARGALVMQRNLDQIDGANKKRRYDDTKEEICVELTEHTTAGNQADSSDMVKELSASLKNYFDVITEVLKNNADLKRDIGDISKFDSILSSGKYEKYIEQWLNNEKPDLKNIDSIFFKPIKYILFDMSQAIYEKNKLN